MLEVVPSPHEVNETGKEKAALKLSHARLGALAAIQIDDEQRESEHNSVRTHQAEKQSSDRGPAVEPQESCGGHETKEECEGEDGKACFRGKGLRCQQKKAGYRGDVPEIRPLPGKFYQQHRQQQNAGCAGCKRQPIGGDAQEAADGKVDHPQEIGRPLGSGAVRDEADHSRVGEVGAVLVEDDRVFRRLTEMGHHDEAEQQQDAEDGKNPPENRDRAAGVFVIHGNI